MDLAITDALLVTMRDGTPSVVEDGTVGVSDGELVAVGPTDSVDVSGADRVVDGSDRVVLPGLVNAHAHTGQTLLRGAAQDVPEIEWMTRALGPLAAHLTPEDHVAGCRLGVLETVRSGATTVCEYAADSGRLVEEVYRPLGVRVVATETINEVAEGGRSGDPDEPYEFDPATGEAALDRAEALFDRYGSSDGDHGTGDGLVTPTYGPQALDMVSRDLLTTIRDRAREHDRRLHVHVAQGERERRQIAARYGEGATTVGVLDDLGLLDERLTAAHLHGATAAERRHLAECGVAMAGCPSSIAAIDGVVPPVHEFDAAGGTVGVGTDQAPGPGGHDALRELRTAAMLSKVRESDPTALPAWRALHLATLGGARALGIDDRVGSLAVGKRADLLVIDRNALSLAPAVAGPPRTVVPNVVYGATSAAVESVLVDGEFVVHDGEFVDADPEATAAECARRAERVLADAEADWRAAGSGLVEAHGEFL